MGLRACREVILRDAKGLDLIAFAETMHDGSAHEQLRVIRLPNLVPLDGCVKSVRKLLDASANVTCLDLSLDEGCINFIGPAELAGMLTSGQNLKELCMTGWCLKI